MRAVARGRRGHPDPRPLSRSRPGGPGLAITAKDQG
jgi:hypothetical protein